MFIRRSLCSALALGLFALASCDSSPDRSSQSASPDSQPSEAPPAVILAPAEQPMYEIRGATATSGIFGNLDGCLSFTPSGDQELLVLAPFGARISSDRTEVDLPGYPPFPFNELADLNGTERAVHKASGPAAPSQWSTCVEDPDAAPTMFIVGPPQS